MIPYLPAEIIARCIEYAVVPTTLTNRCLRVGPSMAINLAEFCRVSHLFYALSAPMLYREIIVRGHSNFLLQLVPFLTRLQRRSMRILIAENGILITQQLNDLLRVPADRIVDPRWVHKLKIFGAYNMAPGAALLWPLLDEAAREMTNIERVVWEPSEGSTCLANILGGLPNLIRVSCSANGPMCAPHLESSFHDIRLKSLVVYCDGTDDGDAENIGGQRNLLRPSAGSLETLHLAFRRIGVINSEGHIMGMLRDTTSISVLKHLRLGFFELTTIVALGMVVRFSALESLQLVHETICHGLPDALRRYGRLSALTTLTATLSPGQMVEILSACDKLRALYIYYRKDEDPNEGEICALDIVEAVGKHGDTLRVLCLCEGYDNEESELTMDSYNIEELAELCPNLEELRVGVRMEDFAITPLRFSKLQHLRHLYVEVFGDAYGDRISEPEYDEDKMITPLCPSWFKPPSVGDDLEGYEGPISRITNLEIGMRIILICFDTLPLTFSIASYGVATNDPELRLCQTYRISQDLSPCNFGVSLSGNDTYCYHGNQSGTTWLAPAGFRYAVSSYDGLAFQAEVLDIPGDYEPGTVGSWTTAFKASCTRNLECEVPLF